MSLACQLDQTSHLNPGRLPVLRPEFARIGLGVAAVVRDFIQEKLSRGEIYDEVVDPPIPPRAVRVIVSRDVSLSWAAQSLMMELQTPLHD